MVNLSISGDSIVFEFINSNYYLQNGKIATPINSLALITDESNIATFKKASSNDIFVAATYDELGKTKNELIEWFKDNAVGATGGGGGGLTPEEAQEMIDESISGKADTTAMTEALTAKLDVSSFNTYSGNVNTAITSIEGDIVDVQTALQGKASNADLQTVSGAVDTKLAISDFNSYSSSTMTLIGNKASIDSVYDKATINSYTAATATVLNGAVQHSEFDPYSSSTEMALSERVRTADFAQYTSATDATLATKASNADLQTVSGNIKTIIQDNELVVANALIALQDDVDSVSDVVSAKLNISDFNTYSGGVDTTITSIQGDITDVQTALQGKASETDLQTVSGNVDTLSGQVADKADTTAMTTALADKLDISTFETYSGSVDTALNGKASQTDLNTVSGNVDTLSGDMANKVDVSAYTAYTSATDTALQGKADTSDLANYVEVTAYTAYTSATDTALSGKASQTDLNTVSGDVATVSGSVANKQDLLVSGTNIKTINNTSLLGSGNIDIQGGGGQTVTSVTQAEYDALVVKDTDTFYIISDATGSSITIDSSLDSGSTNPVENSAITTAINAVSGDVDTLSGAVANKVDTSAYTAYTSSTQTAIGAKASQTDLETVSGNVATVSGQVDNKQDTLVSGTNIKTINSQSLLGSGDIVIQGGGTVDSALTLSSNNAVANSAITKAIQDNELVVANALIDLQDDVDTVSAATASNTAALSGYKLWKGTQAQYDAIVTKDEDTIYFIANNS